MIHGERSPFFTITRALKSQMTKMARAYSILAQIKRIAH